VALRSKAYVCSSSIVGIAGSNPAEGIDFCLLCLLCVVKVAVPAAANRPFRESYRARARVCVCVCVRARACGCV
jgi:hypothetical protein